jgi:hypothetical protein
MASMGNMVAGWGMLIAAIATLESLSEKAEGDIIGTALSLPTGWTASP